MSRVHYKRLIIILLAGAVAVVTLAIMMVVLSQEINLYLTPTEIKHRTFAKSQRVRVGGLVVEHSLVYVDKKNLEMLFDIVDQQGTLLRIHYQGLTPTLFKEGKGVIAEGQMQDGQLYAKMLLAKHDENYKPPGT